MQENYMFDSGSLGAMEVELSKMGHGVLRRNFLPKGQASMIRDYFSSKGYVVQVIETSRRLDEMFHIEIIKQPKAKVEN